ncbi:MAG: ATP phosphoribosyltransferase regulatory subunit [Deferribacteraceae bacterium]|jgi:ATP phosphoribosyltransferase regulatory subunit|nr:ATP phosphoribosyltransferase regulatory subunit [Deferribacteraceae bacterium]
MALLTGAGFGSAPERTALRNKIEQNLRTLFRQYGYNEITLPVYEYYSVLNTHKQQFLDETLISFTDISTGRLLVLRPDFTPQASRLAAGYRGAFPLPIRLSYGGAVFRNADIQHGAKAEKHQLGCELYGAPESEGDKELLLLITNAARLSQAEYSLLIGDAAYLARIRALLGEYADEYFDILKQKKLYRRGEFASKLKLAKLESLSPLIHELPILFGGAKALEKLKKLSAFDQELSSRIEHISAVFSELIELGLPEENILFDLAQLRALGYYTGLTFELFHRRSGVLLGAGGRYDSLMNSFNLDINACGFSLYLEELADVSGYVGERIAVDYLVLNNFKKAQELRQSGAVVVSVYDEGELARHLEFADVKNLIR